MPYIKPEKRHALDPHIDSLINALREAECDDDANSMGGNINYIITRLLIRAFGAGGYDERSEAISVLECAKLEFYRKHMAAYEDQKEFENGTIVESAFIVLRNDPPATLKPDADLPNCGS